MKEEIADIIKWHIRDMFYDRNKTLMLPLYLYTDLIRQDAADNWLNDHNMHSRICIVFLSKKKIKNK